MASEKGTKKKGVRGKDDGTEKKKMALLRILQILNYYSDYDHPLTYNDIMGYLESDYRIQLERKAVAKNIESLKNAGFDIRRFRNGNDQGVYIEDRDFDEIIVFANKLMNALSVNMLFLKDEKRKKIFKVTL